MSKIKVVKQLFKLFSDVMIMSPLTSFLFVYSYFILLKILFNESILINQMFFLIIYGFRSTNEMFILHFFENFNSKR